MLVTAQKFQSLYALVCESLAWSNHRTTLPQSALRAASSLREGAGERSHSSRYSLKSGGAGDFHRPNETLMILAYTIQRTTLPQSALRADSSLREGAGERSHSSGYSLKSGVTGDFHRPYGNSEDLTSYHSSGHSPRGWVTDSRISLRPWCPASGSVLRKVRQTALPRLRDTRLLPSHSGSSSRPRPPAQALQRPEASPQTH